MLESENQPEYQKRAPWGVHFIVTCLILLVAIVIFFNMVSSKPEGRKRGDRPAPSVAVETRALAPQDYQVWIDSYGTAESLTRTQLVADVSGRVINVSPKIRAGSSFKEGDVLVEIDDRDFRIEVDIAASSVADAEVKYLQELAQAELAEKEWNIRPQGKAAKSLALREPQVAAAKAALDAAKARLAKASLNLERTKVRAPFDGKVLRQSVDIGQVISPSQSIAEIYSTDAIEVRLPVKIADLDHLVVPDAGEEMSDGPRVIFEGELGSRTYQWEGEVVRSEGAFDSATRMLYVVARIDEPFQDTQKRPAVRIGQFLRASIEGRNLSNVFVIPRRAVSQDYFVSIAQEGVLKKRKVFPLWTDATSVVVPAAAYLDSNSRRDPLISNIEQSTIQASDVLVLTPTANLPDGTRVKSIDKQSEETDASKLAKSKDGNSKQSDGSPTANASANN
ncbi:efflux RND transporter periplasmic adaptor subunit [Pleionea sediminis]|uniref:efflux RND transporter periplasmic adaptor subunit n=1 Tax=Pleionea sediminis TaxID=2569479 RepID=UPI001186A71A|nr:efflux RND transporter periplasmic adaptor subunit [Pleionea sediminis]